MAKVITVITPGEDHQYKVKIEVEDLEGFPLEIIVNALVSVTTQFIEQIKRQTANHEKALQLGQSEASNQDA